MKASSWRRLVVFLSYPLKENLSFFKLRWLVSQFSFPGAFFTVKFDLQGCVCPIWHTEWLNFIYFFIPENQKAIFFSVLTCCSGKGDYSGWKFQAFVLTFSLGLNKFKHIFHFQIFQSYLLNLLSQKQIINTETCWKHIFTKANGSNIKCTLNSCSDTSEVSIYDWLRILACTLGGPRVYSGVLA